MSCEIPLGRPCWIRETKEDEGRRRTTKRGYKDKLE